MPSFPARPPRPISTGGWSSGARDVGLESGESGSNVARIVREGEQLPLASAHPIEPGDIVGIDSGLRYLGFETDMKRTIYVLREGETEPPQSIRDAWQETLGVADIYVEEMVPGRTGTEVWSNIVERVQDRGYQVVGPDAGGVAATDTRPEIGIYGHSVGNNSHDIGARVAEDFPLAYGQRVRFPLVEGGVGVRRVPPEHPDSRVGAGPPGTRGSRRTPSRPRPG